MALTGQLSDMSLAELIEFFCNQRKTGRLKVDYHRGHGVFFIKDGELVDAKVGALSGADAVYFALTLPNAAFDFSADFEPTRRTIQESWTQVVLEGLRRLDEGVSPSEADAFGGDWSPSEADLAMFMDHIERLSASESKDEGASKEAKEVAASRETSESAAPMSMMVESAGSNGGGGKKKMMMVGAAACVVLICAVAAIPVARKFGGSQTSAATVSAAPSADAADGATNDTNAVTPDEAATTPATDQTTTGAETQTADAAPATVDPAAAALAARREREQREREARERARRLEEAKKNESAEKTAATDVAAANAKPAVAAPGPKMVRVSVSYDEAGRVTQASVAGVSPGAEAYGGTAVRIARGRRFPAGKAGGTVITIPVN
ncbi:MAG TPA: DUF4388 domain-containing protein [Pyrinomonadaceae bacterium]|jgi:hypothetical protein|nr:DUF4388 domain-containing protein [Pyrinomonadaceae bacterium]